MLETSIMQIGGLEITKSTRVLTNDPWQPIVLSTAPVGIRNDNNDERELGRGRNPHIGYPIGKYVQTPPFFFTRDKWPVPVVDMYRGGSCFLIAGGPSFLQLDAEKLRLPGVLTFGMNNSPRTFRPKMWTCVDSPSNFIRSIWMDPTIMKFAPISHVEKQLFNSDAWQLMDMTVGDCPNVLYYKRNEKFQAKQYLWEDTINWGNHTDLGGGRSVMLAAVRIMFLLGIRRIFLLGVDFDMNEQSKYHFDQDRAAGSIKCNTGTYRLLQERFTELEPIFRENGLEVYNCNKQSKLTAFEHMPFDEAIKIASLPIDVAAERTNGLYDRQANERKQNKVSPPSPPKTDDEKAKVIVEQVNAARDELHRAKRATETYERTKETPSFNQAKLKELIDTENSKRRVFRQLCKVRKELLGY